MPDAARLEGDVLPANLPPAARGRSIQRDEETQERFGISPRREFPHPYKACIVLGHVSDPEGKKESKSSGNYTSPDLVLEGSFQLRVAPGERLGEEPAADAVMNGVLC